MIVSFDGKQYKVKIYRGVVTIYDRDNNPIAVYSLQDIIREKLVELQAKGGW